MESATPNGEDDLLLDWSRPWGLAFLKTLGVGHIKMKRATLCMSQ